MKLVLFVNGIYVFKLIETIPEEQCAKKISLSKVVDDIINFASFEHRSIILEGVFKYKLLKHNMVVIVLDQS